MRQNISSEIGTLKLTFEHLMDVAVAEQVIAGFQPAASQPRENRFYLQRISHP